MESSYTFDPDSHIYYYVNKQKQQCIVAGNHRIRAKQYIAKKLNEARDSGAEGLPEFNPSLSVIKLSSNIPQAVVAEISNGTSVHVSLIVNSKCIAENETNMAIVPMDPYDLIVAGFRTLDANKIPRNDMSAVTLKKHGVMYNEQDASMVVRMRACLSLDQLQRWGYAVLQL